MEECKKEAGCEELGYPAGTARAPIGGDLWCAGLYPETGTACIVHHGMETGSG
jgi:hypothetical protein